MTNEIFVKTPTVLLFETNLKKSVVLNQVLTRNGIAVTTANSSADLESIVRSGEFDSIVVSASPDGCASFDRAMKLVKDTPVVTIGPGTSEVDFIQHLRSKLESAGKAKS